MLAKFLKAIIEARENKLEKVFYCKDGKDGKGVLGFSARLVVFYELDRKHRERDADWSLLALSKEAHAEILKKGPARFSAMLRSTRETARMLDALEVLGRQHEALPGNVRIVELVPEKSEERSTIFASIDFFDDEEDDHWEIPNGFRLGESRSESLEAYRARRRSHLPEARAREHLVEAYLKAHITFKGKYRTDKTHFKAPQPLVKVADEVARKKKQKTPLPLAFYNYDSRVVEVIDDASLTIVENKPFTIHDRIALFDVLARLRAVGAIKQNFLVVKGHENHVEVKKEIACDGEESYLVSNKAIARLTGNSDKFFISRVKKAIIDLGGLMMRFEQTVVIKGKWTPAMMEWMPIRVRFRNTVGNSVVFGMELDKMLFNFEDYVTADVAGFSRISALDAGNRAAATISDLYTRLILTAGRSSTGKRDLFMSIEQAAEAIGQSNLLHTWQKKRLEQTFFEHLEKLKEAGLVESYAKLENKAYKVVLGG